MHSYDIIYIVDTGKRESGQKRPIYAAQLWKSPLCTQ